MVGPAARARVRVRLVAPDHVAGPRPLVEVPIAPHRRPYFVALAQALLIAVDEPPNSGLGPGSNSQ